MRRSSTTTRPLKYGESGLPLGGKEKTKMVSNGAWNGKRKQTMKLCMHGEHMAEGLYYFDMNVSTVQDDEKLNWMVQQWLQERGYVRALKALQEVNAYVFVKNVYYACRQ
jgi:hypothetical protein